MCRNKFSMMIPYESVAELAGGRGWSIDLAHFWRKKKIGIVWPAESVSNAKKNVNPYPITQSSARVHGLLPLFRRPPPRPSAARDTAAARRARAFAPAPARPHLARSPRQACTARRLAPTRVAAARRLPEFSFRFRPPALTVLRCVLHCESVS